MINSVKHLCLTHLRIILHHTLDQEVPDTYGFGRTLANTTCHVDLHEVAAGFINSDTMPTLKYLFLVACGCGHAVRMYSTGGRCYHYQAPHQWLSSNAWRVVHNRDVDPDDPESSERSCALEELSVEETEKVMDREDFRISPHEEVRVFFLCRQSELTEHRTRCDGAALPEGIDSLVKPECGYRLESSSCSSLTTLISHVALSSCSSSRTRKRAR